MCKQPVSACTPRCFARSRLFPRLFKKNFISDHTCSNAFLCDYSLLPTVYLRWVRLVHGVIVVAIVLLGSSAQLDNGVCPARGTDWIIVSPPSGAQRMARFFYRGKLLFHVTMPDLPDSKVWTKALYGQVISTEKARRRASRKLWVKQTQSTELNGTELNDQWNHAHWSCGIKYLGDFDGHMSSQPSSFKYGWADWGIEGRRSDKQKQMAVLSVSQWGLTTPILTSWIIWQVAGGRLPECPTAWAIYLYCTVQCLFWTYCSFPVHMLQTDKTRRKKKKQWLILREEVHFSMRC